MLYVVWYLFFLFSINVVQLLSVVFTCQQFGASVLCSQKPEALSESSPSESEIHLSYDIMYDKNKRAVNGSRSCSIESFRRHVGRFKLYRLKKENDNNTRETNDASMRWRARSLVCYPTMFWNIPNALGIQPSPSRASSMIRVTISSAVVSIYAWDCASIDMKYT